MFNKPLSKEYKQALALHKEAHIKGVSRKGRGEEKEWSGQRTFEGSEILHVMPAIRQIVKDQNIKHCLDFGCGKARAYSLAFDIEGERHRNFYHATGLEPACVYLYDPGLKQFEQPPRQEQKFDLTICTDVLEHIPEQDTDTVLDYLFEKTNKALVISIACHESLTHLKGDVNAHVNVKPAEWWIQKLDERQKKKPLSLHIRLIEDNGRDQFNVLIRETKPK